MSRRGLLSAGVSMLLLVGVLAPGSAVGVPRPASAPGSAAASVGGVDVQARVDSRPDRLAALLTAGVQGSPVEVESSRTGSTREWANPDGSFSMDTYPGPNWVQDDTGAWQEIDTTLVADGEGGFTTKASPLEVTVGETAGTDGADPVAQDGSAADPASLVSLGSLDGVSEDARASDAVSVGWPGDLPAPTVSGPVATFADVSEGVDVRVKVTPTGAETFVDLAQRPAEVPESGWVVDLPLAAKGLTVTEDADGGVVLTNKSGDVVAAAPQARIWDATSDPRSGLPVNEIAVDTELVRAASGWVLRVAVPVSFLDRAGLVYPVTVDPSVSVPTLGDTFVEKGYNDTNFAGEDDLRVGTYDGGTHVARSYLKFSLDPEAPGLYSDDTVVTSAKLHLFEYWSSSCTDTRVDSHRATEHWSAGDLTWNGRTSYSSTADGSVTEAHGYTSSCPAAWLNGSTGIDVTDTVQAWAGPSANYGIVLDAASETDSLSWKRFYSGEYATTTKRPYLTVTYYHKPATPTAVTVAPLSNGYTNTDTPTVSVGVSDVDGGNERARFQVLDSAGAAVGAAFYSAYRSGDGLTAAVAMGAGLADGASYTVRAWGDDGTYSSTASTDSASFTVDTVRPTISAVSCSGLTRKDWVASAPGSSTCTVSAADTLAGVAAVTLRVDGVALAPTTAGANTFPLPTAGLAPGYHTIVASAVDKAGNVADDTAEFSNSTGWYGIGSAVTSFTAPVRNLRSSRNFPIAATGPLGATSATLSFWDRTKTPAVWTDVSSQVTKADGSAWGGAVLTANNQVSVSALTWKTSADQVGSPAGGSADLRLCFTGYSGGDKCVTTQVQVLAHAFGGSFATAPVGPGEVALSTGEVALEVTDAALPGANSDIAVGRSWLSLSGTTDTEFGTGWAALLPQTAAPGAGEATVIDRTATDKSLLLEYPDGSADVFLCTATVATCSGAHTYSPAGDTALTGATLVMSTDGKTLTYTDPDTVATTWKRPTTTSTLWTVDAVSDPAVAKGASQPQPGTFGTLSVDGLSVSGDDYQAVVAPTPAGVSSCTWSPTGATFGLVRGCAALTIVTAKPSTPIPGTGTSGDYPGKIRAVITTLYDPATQAVTSTVVSRYAYDSTRMLVAQWDPRDTLTAGALSTRYAYASARLTSITPASSTTNGLNAWTLGYDTTGRLTTVSRAGQGTTTVAYGVALSGPNLATMTATATATWDQPVAPASAAEVFPAGASTGDPRQGSISYMDSSGRTVNTAAFGHGTWNIDATAYTPTGQVDWALSAGNRARALASTAQPGDPQGLPVGDTKVRARLLRTDNVYQNETSAGGDPSLLVASYAPMADVALANGTRVSARAHTTTTYDQGSAASITDADGTLRTAPWRLATTVVSAAAVREDTSSMRGPDGLGYTDRDAQTTINSYANTGGPANMGWLFATPTSVTVKDVTSGHDLTTVTVLDNRGRVVQTRQPMATGTDARTTLTVYYTGDASAPVTACDNHPEWAGLTCQSGPAAQPSGTTLPTTVTTYTRDLDVATEVDTSGATQRTTTTTYDAGARVSSIAVTIQGAPAGNQAVPTSSRTYWPETGLVKTVSNGSATATTTYDAVGRAVSQSDGAGNTATTTYDAAGRVATSNDGKATTTYTYNGTDASGLVEYRGLVTGKTVGGLVGAASAFTAGYGADGDLTVEVAPNGVTATTVLDPVGREVSLTYMAGTTVVAGSSRVWGSEGNVVADTGLGRSSTYRYDGADRLVGSSTILTGTVSCTIRAYTFDDDSNRTGLDSWTGPATACPATTGTPTATAPRSYDTADRATLAGYAYDTLGRSTVLPAADSPTIPAVASTLTYYTNDLAATVTTGTTTRAYSLDASGRIASWADTVSGVTGATVRNHYDDDGDSPAWTDLGDGTWTRMVAGISGDLGLTVTGNVTGPTATVGQIVDLHGDVIATLANTTGANTVTTTTAYTEYGTQPDPGTSQGRYGWLGAKQRQTEPTSGLILMGVRLYNPTTGRFLQVDPIPGGSAGPYLHPTNPITVFDLTGQWWGWRKSLTWASYGVRAARNVVPSLYGLGYARASGAHCSRRSGLFVACTGGRRWARPGGITFGNVHVTRDPKVRSSVLRHEQRHASQWAVMGPLFIPSYGAWSGMSSALHRVVRRRGCSAGYACYNPYEIHAGLKDGGYRS